jgi:pyridoxine 4-dehydrogenase
MSTTIAGKQVGPIGFGLMSNNLSPSSIQNKTLTSHLGLTRPPPLSHDTASKVMKAALSKGANLWNGGMFYGPPTANSLQLLHHYFTLHPSDAEKVVLSIKGCFSLAGGPDCSPEGIKTSIETALKVLDGKKKIDIFEPARIDHNFPIEEIVRSLKGYVESGDIGGIGLSEVNASTIRRAYAVFPISSVEIELSLFTTEATTNGVLETCAELEIPVIAYSPLSRGWLTGAIKSLDDLPETDMRRIHLPRFQPEAFEANKKLADKVGEVASKKGVTVAQVAIAWVRAQGKGVVPIPGCTTVERVDENLTVVELSTGELEVLEVLVKEVPVMGHRYMTQQQKYLNQ